MALRAELDAVGERARKAAIRYEIGHLTETLLKQEAQAVQEYLGAYNLDPSFRPPLLALIRIFERRRSFKNLARLYEAETTAAVTPEERASALVDRGALAEDHLGQPDVARALYRQAIDAHPEGAGVAALYLERLLLAGGDRDAALDALVIRAERVKDPTLKGMLLGEIAREREARGDVEGALEAARQAVTLPAARWRFLEQLERIARRHNRVPDIVAALEGRAALASQVARGENVEELSGAFSVRRFADPTHAAGEAAALYREAARLRLAHLGDAPGALAAWTRAVHLRPDDVALIREHMLACELAGDLAGAAADARRLLASGITGPHAAALHFRIAEEARSRSDADAAFEALAAALEANPSSAAGLAMLEDLALATGRVSGWVQRLAEEAERAEGEARARLAWKAAHLATVRLGDAERAHALYALAHAAAADKAAIAREWFAACVQLGHLEGVRQAARALLSEAIDDAERGAVLRDLHELEYLVLQDEAAAAVVLEEALATRACAAWAPDIARMHAASTGDLALLARAHRQLAARARDPDTAAAHLCAAARARVRQASQSGPPDAAAPDLEEARALLEEALHRVPGHRYAVALLEEVYRARGDVDAAVKLLRDAAEADRAGKAALVQLLVAGAAAEAAGDHALAIRTYEEAAERDPTAFGPLLALRRIAEARGDDALLGKALERLSELEVGAGAPSQATLELGEHWQILADRPELAEPPLRIALTATELAAPAALGLALLGPAMPGAMVDGLRELLGLDSEGANVALQRELGGALFDVIDDRSAAVSVADAILAKVDDEPWARLTRLRATFCDPSRVRERAEALLALADSTSDVQASAELIVHGLRAAAFAGHASDDAVVRAGDLEKALPGSFVAAFAGIEALTEADDPGERADALGRWLAHAGPMSASALRAARARALVAAGRSDEACELLESILREEPDDLASWEALRVAARDAERWEDVVRACDHLAGVVDGEYRAMLLEEAAAVWMDHLERDDEAEKRLRDVLAIDGTRAVAYDRLHDLLVDRGDETALLALVKSRADGTDDPEQLAPLLYEMARLHRSLGQREEALAALDNLLVLEPEHVGGLALLVELQVQRESWKDAVRALRMLANVPDVPVSQRRIARLGAADFLEKKLGDLGGALDELARIEELGLADCALFERMADLAERAGRVDDALAALAKAADAAPEPALRAAIERRAGRMWDERKGDEVQAIAAYRRALEAVPTDVLAGSALTALLVGEARTEHVQRFESAVRAALEPDPTEPDLLRALATAAEWRQDRALRDAVLGALVATDTATPEERERLLGDTEVLRRLVSSAHRLSDARLAEIAAPGFEGPVLEIARLAAETLIDMDRLEPAQFGLGRGDLVNPRAMPPVAQELLAIASLLGAPPGDVYIGGRDPQLMVAIPSYKGRPAWLLGTGIAAPLVTMRRFEVGRWATGLRLGLGPYVGRGPEASATALFAVIAAAGTPLPAGEGRTGLADATRAASKVISRRVRKALPELVAKIGGGGAPIVDFAFAAHATLARGGLLVAGDLPSVIGWMVGGAPDRDRIREHGGALDLLRFWISSSALAARRELGLAI
jgi:predicted Zn-dependent protease